jgi:multimeric flavodoxin WrbA
MEKSLVLGVSGSPRKGANTDILLETALSAAAESDFVETKAVYLRDFEIAPCKSCFGCCREAGAKNNGENACVPFRDGMDELYPLLLRCKALIIAAPVFFGSMCAQAKVFLDRTEGLLRYGTSRYKDGLRNKILAGITVGGNRNGGQEFTLQQIHYFGMVQDMIVVGAGPENTPGCYLGGCGTTWPSKGDISHAVKEDPLGMKNSAMIGRRVSEALMLMKGRP